MRQGRRIGIAIGVGAMGLLMSGCTAATTPAPTSTATVSAVAPSTPPPTVTVTATSIATPAPTTRAAGCPKNDVAIPSGADTAKVGDVDDSDSDATEFYAESLPFEFGVRTASSATIVTRDDLAGPGVHSGWIARLASGPVAVLDDGRNATLLAFVDCRFVTPKGADGKPYTFTLNGFGSYGTGVGCGQQVDGTRELLGLNAVKVAGGRYRIDRTVVTVSADGRSAKNGTKQVGTSTYAADSPQVRAAQTSTCGAVPKVHTSGQ